MDGFASNAAATSASETVTFRMGPTLRMARTAVLQTHRSMPRSRTRTRLTILFPGGIRAADPEHVPNALGPTYTGRIRGWSPPTRASPTLPTSFGCPRATASPSICKEPAPISSSFLWSYGAMVRMEILFLLFSAFVFCSSSGELQMFPVSLLHSSLITYVRLCG